MNLPGLDWGKVLSTTFPGFFLALALFMVVDILAEKDLAAKALSGDASFVTASIASLAALSTALGVLADALAHIIFERVVRRSFPAFLSLNVERAARLRAHGRPPDAFNSIYRVEVDASLRQSAIESQYRYSEFSVNATLALAALSVVLPLYLLLVLGFGLGGSMLVAGAMAAFTGLMSHVAVYNLEQWEDVRTELVFGTLDAPKKG